MGEKRMPTFRVTYSRKDGEEIEFTNYKGEDVSKKFAPLGVLFDRDKGEGFTLLIDKAAEGHKLDSETYWYNVYPTDDKPSGKPQPSRGNGNTKPKGRKASDDSDLDFG